MAAEGMTHSLRVNEHIGVSFSRHTCKNGQYIRKYQSSERAKCMYFTDPCGMDHIKGPSLFATHVASRQMIYGFRPPVENLMPSHFDIYMYVTIIYTVDRCSIISGIQQAMHVVECRKLNECAPYSLDFSSWPSYSKHNVHIALSHPTIEE